MMIDLKVKYIVYRSKVVFAYLLKKENLGIDKV